MRSLFFAKAAWIDGREMVHDPVIDVVDGVIESVSPRSRAPKVRAKDAVHEVAMLLPGFIDSHSHLEYTRMRGRLPKASVDYATWIDSIGMLKLDMSDHEYEVSAREGLVELAAGGTTTVIDSTQSEGGARAVTSGPLRHFVFWELLGLDRERAEEEMARLETRLFFPPAGSGLPSFHRAASPKSSDLLLGVGVNPHAPYTVGPELRVRARTLLAGSPTLRCAWHLCETEEELELFTAGTGCLARMLERHGLPLPFAMVPACSPVEFLGRVGLLHRCDMAFHLNHPGKGEVGFFAAPRAVVHCPGTHRFFKRPPFAMWEALNSGANVCLGTDSLASSESLSMLQALRDAAEDFPFLSGPQLLDMVTRNPARTSVLAGAPAPLGVIAPGALADFVALCPGDKSNADLRNILVSPGSRIEATYIGGKEVYRHA